MFKTISRTNNNYSRNFIIEQFCKLSTVKKKKITIKIIITASDGNLNPLNNRSPHVPRKIFFYFANDFIFSVQYSTPRPPSSTDTSRDSALLPDHLRFSFRHLLIVKTESYYKCQSHNFAAPLNPTELTQ